jgi:hypothetical protein
MPTVAIDLEGAARELSDGAGYVLFERFFDEDLVAEARALLWRLAEDEGRPDSGLLLGHRTVHIPIQCCFFYVAAVNAKDSILHRLVPLQFAKARGPHGTSDRRPSR